MEKRIKAGLAISSKHLQLIDDSLRLADVRSRNDFVEEAVSFYAGYLTAKQNPAFFEEMFTSSAEKKMTAVGNKLSREQYKVATFLTAIAHILVDNLNLPSSYLKETHEKSMKEVQHMRGTMRLTDFD